MLAQRQARQGKYLYINTTSNGLCDSAFFEVLSYLKFHETASQVNFKLVFLGGGVGAGRNTTVELPTCIL